MKKFATMFLTLAISLSVLFPAVPVRAEGPEDFPDSVISDMTDKLKGHLDDIRAMSDEELEQTIRAFAQQYHITLSDGQVEQLIRLCRQIAEVDEDELEDKLEEKSDELKETLKKVSETGEKMEAAKGTFFSLLDKAKGLFSRAADFFSRIKEYITKK